MTRDSRDAEEGNFAPLEEPSSGLPCYLQFMELLHANYATQHGTNFYATEMQISERALSEACEQVVGITAKTVIEAKLFAESILLLQQTAFNIDTVAKAVGFPDGEGFTRFFIRQSGISPGAFRVRDRCDAIDDYASIRSSSLN